MAKDIGKHRLWVARGERLGQALLRLHAAVGPTLRSWRRHWTAAGRSVKTAAGWRGDKKPRLGA